MAVALDNLEADNPPYCIGNRKQVNTELNTSRPTHKRRLRLTWNMFLKFYIH